MSVITVETRPCTVCGSTTALTLDRDKFERWQQGELIQNVWPEKTADEREMLITGIHPVCWDNIFGEED